MAQVRAKTLCFVDNGLRQEGDVFEYNGVKNTNLEYLKGDSVDEEVDEGSSKKWAPKSKRASADEGSV
jgi:hypothetical protein